MYKEKLKEYKWQFFIFALLLTILTIPDITIALNESEFNPSLTDYLFYLVICLSASLAIGNNIGRILIASFIAIQYTQFIYYLNFGSLLKPTDTWLIFIEAEDIAIGTLEAISNNAAILAISFLLIAALFYCVVRNNKKTIAWAYISIVILATIPTFSAAKIANTPFEKSNSYGPSMEKSVLKNSIHTILWGSIKFIPTKLYANNYNTKQHKPYTLEKNLEAGQPSIVLILGESISSRRMSLFGHSRETTKNIENLVKSQNGKSAQAISAAVLTKTSAIMLFNSVREPDNARQAKSLETNLFKLAKENGYQTAFVSSQKMLASKHEIGGDNIDAFIDHNAHPKSLSISDHNLNKMIDSLPIDYTKKFFIVINTRTAHIPYKANVPGHQQVYSKQQYPNPNEQTLAEYDDALIQFDYIADKAIRHITAHAPSNTMVVITSDHGQRLGEKDGKFGHGILDMNVGDIPFIAIPFQTSELAEPKYCPQTHYDIAKYIAHLIGFSINNSNDDGSRFLNGTELDGSAGFLAIPPKKFDLMKKCSRDV